MAPASRQRLRQCFGLIPGVEGEITWRGRSIRGRSPADNIRDGIIYCPHGAEGFRTLTVRENIELGVFALSHSDSLHRMLPKIFELFPVLAEKAYSKGGQLSGGERQMLSIAIGLVTGPRLAMLDEPSGGLAPMLVEAMFQAIRKIIAEFGTSI